MFCDCEIFVLQTIESRIKQLALPDVSPPSEIREEEHLMAESPLNKNATRRKTRPMRPCCFCPDLAMQSELTRHMKRQHPKEVKH